MNNIIIGIDPSINCTGICIYNKTDNTYIYYMIPSKATKKMQKFKHKFVNIIPYNKDTTKYDNSIDKEFAKTNDFKQIIDIIDKILKKYKPQEVHIEGISYGSTGNVADLAGLNYMIRYVLINNNIKFKIIPPTSVKKYAVANGQADKNTMIYTWKKLDRNITDINDIKIDDLADSYFIARYI